MGADRDGQRGPIGSRRRSVIPWSKIEPYMTVVPEGIDDKNIALHFEDHTDRSSQYPVEKGYVHVQVPLLVVLPYLTVSNMKKVANIHNVNVGTEPDRDKLASCFEFHDCVCCNLYVSIFKTAKTAVAVH